MGAESSRRDARAERTSDFARRLPPTSALDPEMTAEVLDVIEELKEEGRDFVLEHFKLFCSRSVFVLPMIDRKKYGYSFNETALVTHEMGFARHVGDVIAFLAEGRILEHGPTAELFAAQRSAECRNFLSRVLKYWRPVPAGGEVKLRGY